VWSANNTITQRNKYKRMLKKGMTLYIIGLGLNDEKDITLKGLEKVRSADKIYLESYTAILQCGKERLEELYGKKVILADRDFVEKGSESMINEAKEKEIAFLVVGDPMSATTHLDLYLRAVKQNIKIEIIHNASVMNAVGIVGLELYKYGKTTSVVFPEEGWDVQTHYDVIKQNKASGLHTLCLLDIKVKEPGKEDLMNNRSAKGVEPRFMTVNQAINNLLSIEEKRKEKVFTEDTLCVGCARLGGNDMIVKAGDAKSLLTEDFGGPLHSLIVPGNLHFMEEEALTLWK